MTDYTESLIALQTKADNLKSDIQLTYTAVNKLSSAMQAPNKLEQDWIASFKDGLLGSMSAKRKADDLLHEIKQAELLNRHGNKISQSLNHDRSTKDQLISGVRGDAKVIYEKIKTEITAQPQRLDLLADDLEKAAMIGFNNKSEAHGFMADIRESINQVT